MFASQQQTYASYWLKCAKVDLLNHVTNSKSDSEWTLKSQRHIRRLLIFCVPVHSRFHCAFCFVPINKFAFASVILIAHCFNSFPSWGLLWWPCYLNDHMKLKSLSCVNDLVFILEGHSIQMVKNDSVFFIQVFTSTWHDWASNRGLQRIEVYFACSYSMGVTCWLKRTLLLFWSLPLWQAEHCVLS